MLTGPLPVWDLQRRRLDVGPVIEWAIGEIRARGVRASTLDRLHEVMDAPAAHALTEHLCQASRAVPVQRLVHALVVRALPELDWNILSIQALTHFRILLPGDAVAPVPLHTDHGIGHPLHERNLWIALTNARATAALHVLTLAESIPLELERRRQERFLVGDAPARPCETHAGEMLLLTPVHVHGARIVREGATRVSIDIRIAPREAAFARNPCTFIPPRGVAT